MQHSATNPNTSHSIIVGIDIAKRVHQLHGLDKETGEIFNLQLKLWYPSAQRHQRELESARAGLSADDPGAAVNRPLMPERTSVRLR